MKHLAFLTTIFFLSLNTYAETCTGIAECSKLYTKIDAKEFKIDKAITPKMTLILEETNLTDGSAKKDFLNFLNINAVEVVGDSLKPMRNGEYLTSPIYLVTPDNIPQMINKDGLVTLVYQTTNPAQKLLTKTILGMSSKKKTKSRQGIVAYNESNIISVSDTYQYAEKIIRAIMKSDLKK